MFLRKQRLLHSEQQRADLDDAAFTVEQQHKEMMNGIHKLYSQGIGLCEAAHEHRVSLRSTPVSHISDTLTESLSVILCLFLCGQRVSLIVEHRAKLKLRTAEKQDVQQHFDEAAEQLDSLLESNDYYMQKAKNNEKMVKDLQVSHSWKTQQVCLDSN